MNSFQIDNKNDENFAGSLLIGCGTPIPPKKIKKKITKIFRFFLAIFFTTFFHENAERSVAISEYFKCNEMFYN
jgi:hypothetical protein